MNSSSLSSFEITPIRLSSIVSLPPSIRHTQSNKIQNLVEYTHIPDSAQISETVLPLPNPDNIFKRNKSIARRITHLVQQRRPPIKEYVQSTALDNCLISATSAEQYVDLEIGQPLIDQWIREGYSHLHIGAVRIILTLHGRKRHPPTGCQSTQLSKNPAPTDGYYDAPRLLHGYSPSSNLLLSLGSCLDLPIPGHSGDTIFIKVEREDEVPTIIQIPKQLPRDQLFELMPLSWITNYEKAFQNTVPVIAPDTTNTRQLDGTFKTVYKPLTNVSTSSSDLASTAPPTAPPDSPIF
ncbi:hypothetical protein Dsin_021813 [Dipteronia sinensis]|uniref:Uncharacterized protein n=1 Tax=Dipteronia sinensis TaxID=43782 RepID=A0AAE0DZ61_9ROSI|nr:hypothetical protein Dsin_021813 [Dipteronia sinensis]